MEGIEQMFDYHHGYEMIDLTISKMANFHLGYCSGIRRLSLTKAAMLALAFRNQSDIHADDPVEVTRFRKD